MKMHRIRSLAVLLGLCIVISPGIGNGALDHSPCNVHLNGAKVCWDIRSEWGVDATVRIKRRVGLPMLLRRGFVKDMQFEFVGRTLSLSAVTKDDDKHVCLISVDNPIANTLQDKPVWAEASIITSAGPVQIATVALAPGLSQDKSRGIWRGSWTIPASVTVGSASYNLVGRTVFIQFKGKVEDVPCASHLRSKDTELDMSGYVAKFMLLQADLAAATIKNNTATGELPETDEESPGVFVPLNSDDDDYDSANKPDKDQNGKIDGEDDLLPIVLHKIQPVVSGAKYGLTFNNKQIRVWAKADRTVPVAPATGNFDANVDTTLYVEGCQLKSPMLGLSFYAGSYNFNRADVVNVTVFDVDGPINVPQYGKYLYSTANTPNTGKWLAPTGGKLTGQPTFVNAEILWDQAPVVGKVTYQVNPNYVWERAVNVVAVVFNLTSPDSQMKPYANLPPVLTAPTKVRASPRNTDSMVAGMAITGVTGPSVGGSYRGVKFIDLGFIQNVTPTFQHGRFDHTPTSKQKNGLSSEQSGMYFLDCVDFPAVSLVPPWYLGEVSFGAYKEFRTDAVYGADILRMDDSPEVPACKYSTAVDPVTRQILDPHVDYLHLQLDFALYVAVHTKDVRNDANNRYVQRVAGNWCFNGSGWFESAGVLRIWKVSKAAGITASTFVEVKDGSPVPAVTGTLYNRQLASDSWPYSVHSLDGDEAGDYIKPYFDL